MPAEKDSDAFCKTTLSAMILNYPPPTIVNLKRRFDNDDERERQTLAETLHFLDDDKYVQDEDLVLIVDAENSWFQLPSDVIIQQYAKVLEDGNARLLKQYGRDQDGHQKVNQTIVFGANKICVGEDPACKYAPESFLPPHLYGQEDGFDIADRPARYLNSKMLMGPAKDLKELYKAGLEKLDLGNDQKETIQSVFATIFSEQQLRRDAVAKEAALKATLEKVKDFFAGKQAKANPRLKKMAASGAVLRYEFSMGLDYTHTLFQPSVYCNEDELLPLLHDNSTDLSEYDQRNARSEHLELPPSLDQSNGPFWRLDLAKHNPSPNPKTAYIDKLAIDATLDDLPKRSTPWTNVPLLQNTYTGSIPAIFLADSSTTTHATANITFNQLWFSPFRRALLRNYIRTPQSPLGYHDSLVGGDRSWDMRGGRGGIWTAAESAWYAWGESDGVCGRLSQLEAVFEDGKGVWLHEGEEGAEEDRLEEESLIDNGEGNELMKWIEERVKLRAEEEKRVREERKRLEEEKLKQEEEMKMQAERGRENAERLRKEEDEKKKVEEEERERNEQEMRDMATGGARRRRWVG